MKKYDVVVAGYTCVDLTPKFNKNVSHTSIASLFRPGKLIEIDGLDISLGGVVPNTGLALKKFGKKVFLNGLIGDDFIGKIAKELFGGYGVSEGIKTTPKAGTAFSIVLTPPGMDRVFLESPGCNQILDMESIDLDAVSQSRIFHFGYPPLLKQFYLNNGDLLFEMFSFVRKMGTVTSLDFSLPDSESESGKIDWPAVMKHILPVTDIFVPSLEEVLQIMMPSQYAKIMSASGSGDIIDHVPINLIREIGGIIIDSGVKILLIKAAHRGVYLMTGDISLINKKPGFDLSEEKWNFRELRCDSYHADNSKVVSASGAGDTAAAAFLSSILDGDSPELSMKYAAIAGRNNLYCRDIYTELGGWDCITREIMAEPNEITDFRDVSRSNAQ
jgi:sugar/nucleoside kinase (ribokinase family)